MRRQLHLAIWLLLLLALAPAAAWAQAEGTAFSCDGTFYQIRQVGATSSLFRVNRSAAAYTTTAVNVMSGGTTNDLGVLLNGLAYNPQDGYMYGLTTTGTSTTLPTSIQMYKIGQGGIQLLGTVTGMPNIQVASGTIDKDGNYYVSSQNSTGTANYFLYRYDLKQTGAARLTATGLRLRNAGNTADLNQTFYDLALNPQDNQLYGVFQNGTLWRIDARTNAATLQAPVTAIKTTADNTDPVGTSFFDVAGNLFVYTNGVTTTANSGGFYKVNLTTGVYSIISNIDPASVSDGASCINPDQRIDIVKEVTSIVRNTTTQFDITFTLRVKNTSTSTASNVQVNDFLWSGSSTAVRANTTFSSTTGKLAQSVAIQGTPTVTADPTNVNPVFTLARNTAYTGIGGAPGTTTGALLTGTQPLTAGQAAIIVFTVRVTYAATTNIPARADNQAYASSTTGANATGYSQVAASGVALSPDLLLASDVSTDGPSLPATANDDVPAPSPIFFSTSISGTVFEDVNYGGGVGRNQTSSQGIGIAGVRVELYANNGAFLTFVTTDAAGNYAFSTTNGTTALANNTTYQVRVVNQSVVSNRPNPGSVTGLLAVQTFKNGVTNEVGGADPNKFDLAANTGTVTGNGQTLNALRGTNTAGAVETLVSVTTPAATAFPAVLGVDFGFNFDLVVNTNASGQGSLSQFIKNSNALTNENLTQVSSVPGVTLTAGMEYAIFMLNNGTTITNGLRAGVTAAGGYNATTGFTITSTAAFDAITDNGTAIDGKLQEALTSSRVAAVAGTSTGAEVTINFNALKGLFVTGGDTRIASLTLNGAKGTVTGAGGAITFSDGAAVTFSGAAVTGSVVTDVTATGNASAGIQLQRSGTTDATNATGVTISSNILRAATTLTGASPVYGDGINLVGASDNTISNNTISNNPGWGILLATNTNSGNTISGNTISTNGTTTGTEKAGLAIQVGSNNLVSANTISSNIGDGIVAASGTSGNRFTQNSFFSNGESGIDLSANAANAGDGTTINDNTDVDTGANGLLNFPVISQAVTSGGNLIITGYAPAGALVELFVADVQADGFGQGRTYLTSWTEGSPQDGDTRTGGYSGLTSGVNQGSETATSMFMFSVPVASLTAAQQTALATSGARLTATATLQTTVNSLAVGNTSEFSGNASLLQNRPLPVELVRFSATAEQASTVLSWTTASEKNNARFVIERSLDGTRFEAVGTVAGQGTSVQAHAYQFVDAQAAAAASLVYYRLRQEDLSGNSSLSAVQVVRFGKVASDLTVTVYPNPTTANATLDLRSLPAGTVQVRLTDLTGRVLSAASVATGQVYPLATAQLPQGSYLVTLYTSTAKVTRLLVKE